MLVVILCIAGLAGVAVGLRFKVLVLVPAIAFAAVAVVAFGLGEGAGAWPIVLSVCSSLAALQIGYFVGAILRSQRRRPKLRYAVLVLSFLHFITSAADAEPQHLRAGQAKLPSFGFTPVTIVDIDGDYGGLVRSYLIKYEDYRKRGVQVRIKGVCLSACSLVTLLPEQNVCVTAHARLAFHQAVFLPGGERDDYGTEALMLLYPSWVGAWIAEKGRGVLGAGYVVMGPAELAKHYATCSNDAVAGQ